jgi:hypothetical protein
MFFEGLAGLQRSSARGDHGKLDRHFAWVSLPPHSDVVSSSQVVAGQAFPGVSEDQGREAAFASLGIRTCWLCLELTPLNHTVKYAAYEPIFDQLVCEPAALRYNGTEGRTGPYRDSLARLAQEPVVAVVRYTSSSFSLFGL